MTVHFGIIVDYGDYENPCICCDKTLCGYETEKACENSTDIWADVTCKKCLKLKDKYEQSEKQDNEIACNQMGEMAKFFREAHDGK